MQQRDLDKRSDMAESAWPLISVIIPTYNSARYLPQALDSVLAQDYPHIEIIVVDDGSTDETPQLIRPYHAHLHFIQQANAGSAAARNTGLAQAHGAYVVFLDADDWLLPGKLRQQAAIMQAQPDVGLVHSGWQRVNEAGDVLETAAPWRDAPRLDIDGWVWYKPVQMGAMLFRKAWLDRVGGFDPDLRQSQDVDLIFRLALAGMTAVWHYQPTFCYRIHPQSTIRRHAERHHAYVNRVLDKLFAHPALPGRLAASESKVRYYNLRWLAVHQYSVGLLTPMLAPLTEAARYSPLSMLETVVDWAFAFARERPFSDQMARDVWPLLAQAANLPDYEWRWLERLLAYWLRHDYPIGEADVDLFLQKRPFWQHALAAEAELGLPAETFTRWWDQIWRYYIHYEEMIPRVNFAPFLDLTPDQIVRLAQHAIVYQPDAVDAELIDYFWQTTMHMGLLPPGNASRFVRLHLTQFGQAALGGYWRKAGGSLSRAVLNTAHRPRAWRAWRDFVQTARAHRRAQQPVSRPLLIAWPDGDMPGLAEWAYQLGQAGFAVQVVAASGGQLKWEELDEFAAAQTRPFLLFAPDVQTALDRQLDRLGAPLLLGDAGWELAQLRQPQALAALLAAAAGVLVQTPAMQKTAAAAGAQNVQLIPPGVDTVFFAPREDNEETEPFHTERPFSTERPFTVLSASEVHWQTDIETGLRAVRGLRDAGVPVQYRLGGVTGYLQKEWVLFTIDDLGLQEVVAVNGRWPLARRRQLMQQADVYLDLQAVGVTPTALEALACAAPVVAHDAGGTRHWLGAEPLTFAHHHADELTAQLCRLAQQPAVERAEQAQWARTLIAPCDWSQTLQAFKELYDRCLNR